MIFTYFIFQKSDMECPICFDLAETTYCDTLICLKCKFFFQGVMRRRLLFSLRCSKFGNCCMKNDITCQKCRFDRCRLANMVDKYCYTELTVSMLYLVLLQIPKYFGLVQIFCAKAKID